MTNKPIRMRDQRRQQAFNQVFILTILTILLILTLIPIGLMIVMSLKDNGQIYGQFWSLPNPIRWANFETGFNAMSTYIQNSLLYSSASVIGVTILASFAGYVFARHRFPFKETLYLLILALLMIPGVLTLIPAFVLVS